MDTTDHNLERTWWALRAMYALVPLLAGLDKFLHVLTDWTMYLSPIVTEGLGIDAQVFMSIVGVIEIGAGILVFARPRLGGYVVSAWLLAIAGNLMTTGRWFDVAVRDVSMSLGAFALAKLTEWRDAHAAEPARRPAGAGITA